MPDFRRGTAAIAEAAERGEGRSFRPWLQDIYWSDDGDFKYVLFLNEIEEIPTVQFHGFLDLGDSGNAKLIARTDEAIGERKDPIEEEWQYPPRATSLAIAVELEPTFKVVNGRERPSGFAVATREYKRKIRDDDGEATDEKEEVVAPVVGLVAQSPSNFFNVLASFDAKDGPIHQTPIKITRVGKKTETTYSVQGYLDLPVDLTNLVEYIDGVSYIGDDLGDLFDEIENADLEEAALIIGTFLLNKRLDELANAEVYDEIHAQIASPYKYAKDKSKGKKTTTRQARPSQRRTRPAPVEEPEATPEPEPEAETADEPEAEAKPKTTRTRRTSRAAAKPKGATKESPKEDRMAELRAKAAAARAAKEAAAA